MIKRRSSKNRQVSASANAGKKRQLRYQGLERRELLAAEIAPIAPAFAPGTPQSVIDQWEALEHPIVAPGGAGSGGTSSPILAGNPFWRWARSSQGTSPNQGDGITVSWGIASDGTLVQSGGSTVGSNLIAFMDGIYGNGNTTIVANKPWFPIFKNAYDSWSAVSGIKFVYEPNDDGVAFSGSSIGIAGVRADFRVTGAPIDGNFNVLAFNYFPANYGNVGTDGDMVIDTSDIYFANNSNGPTGENRGLFNTLVHEIGHGIGLDHAVPINQTKVMEPGIVTNFYGAQEDDIYNANVLYGDRFELGSGNNSVATATAIGSLIKNEPVVVNALSIDDATTDRDFYQFSTTVGGNLSVSVRPVGTSYLLGPQSGTPAPSLVDRQAQSDLSFRVLDSTGSVIVSQTLSPVGKSEFNTAINLPSAGSYFIEVFAGIGFESQAYQLTAQLGDPLEVGPSLLAVRPDKSALLTAGQTLNVAPREFNLLFKGGSNIKESSINGNVSLVRSGGDGVFGNGNDIIVDLGYVGFVKPGDTSLDNLQQIVMRPASSASHDAYSNTASFPDDLYQIQLVGAGLAPLTNLSNEPFNGGKDSSVEFRLDRGAQVVAVVPQPVNRSAQRITVGNGVTSGTFALRFNGETTSSLAFNATPAQIQTALEALNSIQLGDIVVTSAGARLYDITFQGQYSSEQVPLLTVTNSTLAGGVTTIARLRTLTQASNQIVVYFDDQVLNSSEVVDPSFYRLINTGATSAVNDDQTLLPASVTYDTVDNSVVLFFASDIPEGNYRLDIGQSGSNDSALATALNIGSLNTSNRFSTTAYLGDENGVNNAGTDIDLYKFQVVGNANLTATLTPHLTSLNGRIQVLNASGATIATVASGAGAISVLNQALTAGTYYLRINSVDGSTGSYLLDAVVTGAGVTLSTSDNNSTVTTTSSPATDLGNLGAAGVTLSRSIQNQTTLVPPYPGGNDEPGHREIQREAHIGSVGTTPATPTAVTQRVYYFPATLGTDTSGNVYSNLITEKEKQIVRQLYEIYAAITGYEFIESDATTPGSTGTMIGKGDFRAVSASLGPNDGVAGLANATFAVLNGAIYNQADRFFGDGFTTVMMHEIGHSLGLGHAYELPSLMGSALPNDVLPGDHDIVHLQRLVPPNSTDIDMYQFSLTESGTFSAETVAERVAPLQSLLNTVVSLYRKLPDRQMVVNGVTINLPQAELIARNDNYFGMDSFLSLNLEPGTYFVGVTSTGNTQFDPLVPDSGFGGTTGGSYELKLNFKADRGGQLRDSSGTAIDGDADGTPGGVYSYWFQASDQASTIYVDKVNDKTANAVDGDGSIGNAYDTIEFALKQAGNRIVVPTTGFASLTGSQFVVDDGVNVRVFTFGGVGPERINMTGVTTPAGVAAAIRNAVNASIGANRLSAGVGVAVNGRVVQLSNIDNLNLAPTATGVVSAGSPLLLTTPNLVRIVGNGGTDDDINTTANNRPYLIGIDTSGSPLADGAEFLVPQGTTVMVQAGALFKMKAANLDVGSSSANISRANGALQMLGTPKNSVFLRSYHDDSIGGNSDGVGTVRSGDFGGIVMRADSDLEDRGIFLNYVNHTDIDLGGGEVNVDSVASVYTPIHLVDSRPTLSFNRIMRSDDAAISASPNSFEDTVNRVGPDIIGNFLDSNSIDGLFIRIQTNLGSALDKLTVAGRFDDTDIAHVLAETLLIEGAAGGPIANSTTGVITARRAGQLVIDPGVVLKMSNARIETEQGASTLIAEGTANRPIIFTSINDDRYGGSGSFDTNSNGVSRGIAGDWGGLYFGQTSTGSIDQSIITFAGGNSSIEGGAASFNAIEIRQADVRIANSIIEENASGFSNNGQANLRGGRGLNQSAAIYVSGAQPILVNNIIQDNVGPAININANALNFTTQPDTGRSTGLLSAYGQFADNTGPLVRLNRMDNNGTNGMVVRGEVLTTQVIWDDTDIVHVLNGLITVENLHTYGGLRLQSSNSESLVIKVQGASSGFTATGTPLETLDRVGGTIQVLGTVGHPVVITGIADDSIGAGFTPKGLVMTNTDNSVGTTSGTPGSWRGFLFDEFSNDRNVAVVRELENPLTNGNDTNNSSTTAQFLGVLAPNQKSGDENRRLGFEVQGFISPNDANDIDLYSFKGTAGTGIWIDVDRTGSALDAVVEVINAQGTVVARSIRSSTPGGTGDVNAQTLTQNPLLGGDFYTQNFRDPGLFFVLPGTAGLEGTYFIRVRSNAASSAVASLAGESRGKYQLQVRLQQVDEFPGSTVQYADIRFAQTAIDVRGLPAHSPLIGEAGEIAGGDTFATAQQLVNLLETDMAAINISGSLDFNANPAINGTDVDWYQFDVSHLGVQVIPGVNDAAGTVSVVFDLDYSDNAIRSDATVAIYDSNRNLIFVGRESNVADDQPSNPANPSTAVSDLNRGSLGKKDPFIGPVHLTGGQTYFMAVMSDKQLPSAMTGAYLADPANAGNRLVRLEPINSVTRVVEDHIGFTGYDSGGTNIAPTTGPLIDISSSAALATHIPAVTLANVGMFIAGDDASNGGNDQLYLADPFNGGNYTNTVSPAGWSANNDDIQDIVIRSDGRMFGYQRAANQANFVGRLVEINPDNRGALTVIGADNIPGGGMNFNARNINANIGSQTARADHFTNSDDVSALTFERVGAATADPRYDVYYVVRESDNSSKLYRGVGATGDATPAVAAGANQSYGLMGSIQTGASTVISFTDGVNNSGVRVSSLNGNLFSLQITRNPSVTPITLTSGNVATQSAVINISATTVPTVGDLITFINGNATLSQFLGASIASGTAASLGSTASPAPQTVGSISDNATNYSTVTFFDGVNTSLVRLTSFAGSFAMTLTRTAAATGITAIDGVAQTLTVNLSNATAPTANTLINLINTDPVASTFMRASQYSGGGGGAGSAASPAAGLYSDNLAAYPVVTFNNGLGGVATARLVTIGSQSPFQLTLTRNATPDAVTSVNAAARTITVNLNSATAPTVQQFLDLINNNLQARTFMLATLATGNATDVGSFVSPAPSGLSVRPTYATSTFNVSDNNNPQNTTSIRLKANVPGITGNFTLMISPNGGNTAATVTGANTTTRVIQLEIGNQNNGGPSALAIINAINNHVDARQIVTAAIVGGNAGGGNGNDGTVAANVGNQTIVTGVGTAMTGNVTGLAFDDPVTPTQLFGVTSNGDFLSINKDTGLAFTLASVPGVKFQGLSLGPQNAEGGIYKDMLFAVTNAGDLYAFDTSGNLQSIFVGGANTVKLNDVNPGGDSPVGIAFSPLDFNLWHPTTRRAGDAGHGINTPADGTREPGGASQTYATGGVGGDRTFSEANGGASMYFGLEQWVNAGASNQSYIPYDGINAQYGILDTNLQRDLTSNAQLANTYGLYGGAQGSMLTNTFSLAGSVTEDRPTLYVNYFLDTENHPGETDAGGQDPFRDSARVYASRDGGTTWELLATNNSALSNADPSSGPNGELPGFLSHLSDAGLNSANPRGVGNQVVQELFDNTGQWRQVRVDLSDFANEANIQLRFDFSTAGRVDNDSVNNAFGELSADNRANRSQDNFHEGFYIDDIIVGYAERGEMVTGTNPDAGIFNLMSNNRTNDRDPGANPDIVNGAYQVEIRRTESEFYSQANTAITDTFDTNMQHINVPGANNSGLLADQNRVRPQGMFIVSSNIITDSSVVAINVQPGTPQAGGSLPHPGSTINFPQTNQERLVPGAVIQNNLITGSSGIRFAGETTANPQRPVPFAKLLNNTIVGRGTGLTDVGIQVVGNASPTIMNNLFTQLRTGIANGGVNTVVESNFFQDNFANGPLGVNSVLGAAGAPLFVDANNRNYYLVSGSTALDSSLNSLVDRLNFTTFKTQLGIPNSPIIAPDRDVFGQLRIASGATPGGGGSSVFKDRGAVDRADTKELYAQLLIPVDNDPAGQDRDPNSTIVYLTNPIIELFSILLGDGSGPNSPFEGTGVNPLTIVDVNDATVAERAVQIVHDGKLLKQGVDYNLGFNTTTGVLLLTPLSTLWDPTGVYTVTLDNTQITDLAGNKLRANQTDGTTKFFILTPGVRLDYGDAPDSYGTLLASNAARHTVQSGATPRLGNRIDSESNGTASNIGDDQPTPVVLMVPTPGTFAITAPATSQFAFRVLNAAPASGNPSIINVSIGTKTVAFELVANGFAPQNGNQGIALLAGDTVDAIASRLAAAINALMIEEGDAVTVTIDPAATDTVLITAFDDEDGVAIGDYNNGVSSHIVFLDENAATPTANFNDVIGFLNPFDIQGTSIAITAQTDGILDAWIDFDGDGAFDPVLEQVFKNQPVTAGVNRLTVFTPAGTSDRVTWARFRISEFGNLAPTGLAIGGEVEDYQVEIIGVSQALPNDDNFEVDEDGVLDTVTDLGQDSLFDNDLLSPERFLPSRYIVDTQPQFGTLTTDPLTGRFTYTPNGDYHGKDTFTYWVSTQPLPGTTRPANASLATVTIHVKPVNDKPLAEQKQFPAVEELALTITAAQLIANAIADEDPKFPISGATAPWNENNQSFKVVSLNINGTVVTSSQTVKTPRATFVVTFSAGAFASLQFTGDKDLNRDNDRGIGAEILESFTFTIEDDARSIDNFTGAPVTVQGTPLQDTKTAFIRVAPTNDTPTPATDFVTIGPIGTSTPVANAWSNYYVGLGQPVPVPTEDQTIVIPAAFLISNDISGTSDAADENRYISNNDALLKVVRATVNNRDATVSVNTATGDITFVPPKDVYGNVVITYVVEDSGIDEDINGVRTLRKLEATGTITVTLQPINDVPVTFNRALTFNESASAGVDNPPHVFTAADLINGTVTETDSVPGLFVPSLPAPFNENEQLATLRVVTFTTNAGTVDGRALPGGTGMLTLASDQGGVYEFDFQNSAFVSGRFYPAPDYNQRTPFVATETFGFAIEDDGSTTDPDAVGRVITLPRQTSLNATMVLSLVPANDAPIFTMPTSFAFDENKGATVVQADFVTAIAPAEQTALDELQRQRVAFSVTAINVPAGLMTARPVVTITQGAAGNWADGRASLSVFPAADAFGFAVYDITATDGNDAAGGAVRTTTKRVTIAINPVNDDPVAYNRALSTTEAVEVDGQSASIPFTAAQLIVGNGTETPSVAGLFPGTLIAPYDEVEQTLRVVAFQVPGAADVDVTSLTGGSGTVTRTTTTGGTLSFTFLNGAFTAGTYTPSTDYNRRLPFVSPDRFSYVISDDGQTTLPGSGFVNFNGSSSNTTINLAELRSLPATVSLSLAPANDPPIFTMPTSFAFDENKGATVVQTDFVTAIAPAEQTALDELLRQSVVFSVTPINVPAGLMTALPVVTITQGAAGTWADGRASLSVFPAADAFGFAVYDVTATDANDAASGAARTTTKRVTIAINPVNDDPVAYNRALSTTEAVEVDGQSASIPFTAAQLIVGNGTETPSVAGLFPGSLIAPYNEVEQTLRVVAFQVPGAADVEVTSLVGGSGTVTRTTTTGGTLSFTFLNGAFTAGTYTPSTDYNRRSPFVSPDLFSYVISDNGLTTLPGSGFVNFNGNSSNTSITLAELRSLPATVSLSLAPANDPPIFTLPSTFTFGENDGTTVVQTDFITAIAPAAQTALDELQRQSVTFSVAAVNVPAGLMTALPQITITQGAAADWLDGRASLTVFPAADAFGFAVYDITARDGGDPATGAARSTTKRITIAINPVNDDPVAFDRSLSVVEAVEVDAETALLTFTAADLLNGKAPELPNVAGAFPPSLIAPYNETEQALRVVAFNVPGTAAADVSSLASGTGTLTRVTANGSILRFTFLNGAFVSGTYRPPVDYNQRTPFVFAPSEVFTYTISDDGKTTLPGSGFVNFSGSASDTTITLTERRSAVASITLTVTPTNDPPIFDVTLNSANRPIFEILERDDLGATTIAGAITGIFPSVATALDERARQTVSFNIRTDLSTIPAGLMAANPVISNAVNPTVASLSVFPAVDAVGTAIYVFEAIDAEPSTPGFVPRTTLGTFTVIVRPVNDAPRIASPAPTDTRVADPDEIWTVDSATGTIRYTLPEDNAAADGSVSPYLFYARQVNNSANPANGRIGLLDAYTVGPDNEDDTTLGGLQKLRIISLPVGTDTLVTGLGGTLTVIARDANGFPTAFNYTPPADYNSNQGDVDFFDYIIEDDKPSNGETWSLTTGGLVENRLTRTVRAEFLMNPVNDAPLFSVPSNVLSVLEDAGPVTVPGFITDIQQGPSTAGDELSDQVVSFTLTALSAENGLFTVSPTIGPDGVLSFTTASDAVGSVQYRVEYKDNGVNDPSRGDINFRPAFTITVNVRPVNDQPRLETTVTGTSDPNGTVDDNWAVNSSGVITYTLREDTLGPSGSNAFVIDARRATSTGRVGLLDVFNVGPANEVNSTLGGSQLLNLISVPTTTALGGTLTVLARDANNNPTRIQYTPPANVSISQTARDSFTYAVQDDAVGKGETWNLGTDSLAENKLTRIGRVEFVLSAVNDAPIFAVPTPAITVLEDGGSTSVASFATGIAPGPVGATDEVNQTVSFQLAAQSPENGLFTVSPFITPNGTLAFTPAVDAFGSIVYSVTLVDSGTNNPTRGDVNTSIPVLVTINVRPVNDAPRLNGSVTGTSKTTTANEAWTVDTTGKITYTMGEDNAPSAGGNAPYVIDIARTASTADRIGLLDPFTVGPNNESSSLLGGSQTLRITNIPAETELGGKLAVLARDANGFITQISYTPVANYNSLQGPRDSFEYTFEDSSVAGETWDVTTSALKSDRKSGTGRVEFVINPLNDPPSFTGASDVTVDEDASSTATVGRTVVPNFVENIFAGPDGADDELFGSALQTVRFVLTAQPGNTAGLFSTVPTVAADGTLSFTTAKDANGLAVFTIVAVDSGSNAAPLQSNRSAAKTFSITVNPVNDNPTFTGVATIAVNEDTGAYSSTTPYATQISAGAANESNQTLTFLVDTPASSAALFSVAPAISSTGFLTFTPAPNSVGTAVISVTLRDSLGGVSTTVPLTIAIREVNDAPVASNFGVSGDEDNTIVVTRDQFLSLAVDPDLSSNTNETLSIVQLPLKTSQGASISLNADGDIVYDPRDVALIQSLKPGQTLTDIFTYRLRDTANALSATATVTVTVAGRNDAPVSLADNAILVTGKSTILRPAVNDTDIDGTVDPATIFITTQPTHGTLTVNPNGTLVYTSEDGFRGVDTIGYTIADDIGQQSEQAIITLNVAPLPTIAPVSTGSYIGESVTVDLSQVPDPTGTLDLSSVEIVRDPSNGTVQVTLDGKIIFTAVPNFVGTDTFDYTIRDTAGRVSEPITVTVSTVNSRLQNPFARTDVNANGQTTAFDALLIINHIARNARGGTGNTVPVADSDRGPNFYDVDGSRLVTILDALRVINEVARLSRLKSGSGEGESSLATPLIQSVSTSLTIESAPVEPVWTDMVEDRAVATFQGVQSASDALLDVLAAGQSDDNEDDNDSSDLDLLDQVFSTF